MIVRPKHFDVDRDKQRELDKLASDETLTLEQQNLVDEVGTDQPFFIAVHSYCFYCAEKLTVPAIMWSGCEGQHAGDKNEIWLHPTCAEQLSQRIVRDVNELRIGKQKADELFAAWKRDHSS